MIQLKGFGQLASQLNLPIKVSQMPRTVVSIAEYDGAIQNTAHNSEWNILAER